MLMKTKRKIVKIQNIPPPEKKEENGENYLEIWWTGTFPQNLELIRLMVSEEMLFTDDGRQSHGISSANTVKQSYKVFLFTVWKKCLEWRYVYMYMMSRQLYPQIGHQSQNLFSGHT